MEIARMTRILPAQRERGVSGGEKKRHEISQLELLKPKPSRFSRDDSGLDIEHCASCRRRESGPIQRQIRAFLMSTHYTRIALREAGLRARVVAGHIVEGGGPAGERLESEGYERFVAEAGDVAAI